MTSLWLWLALAQIPDEGTVVVQVDLVRSEERRQLKYDEEVWCARLKGTKAVPSGNFRVQCDEGKKECLVAPQRVLFDGVETEEEPARTRLCVPMFHDRRLQDWAREGFTFVEAVAEAPDGWFRDERGRIIQVNFDLHRRVYFGGAWAPQYNPREGFGLGRGRTDFGIEVDLDAASGHQLHRLRFLEGSIWIGNELRVDAALASYSWSILRSSSPLWLTTFIGKPHRFDLDLNLSGWFEALRWETVSGHSFLTLATATAAIEIWHSKNLDSFVRVRAGPGAEMDIDTRSFAIKPLIAVDADLTLDRAGFHHFTALASAEKLYLDLPQEGRHLNPARLRFQAGYEVILLAINDYPLTFVVDARATWREDLVNIKPGWDFSAHTGLRFSFWAPPRRDAGQVAFR